MYVYVAIAIAAALFSAVGTWNVNEWRHDSIDKARIEQEARERIRKADKVDVAAAGHESDKRQLRTEFIVITERVEHVLQSDFYAAGQPACLDDAGLRELTAAVGPGAAASQPARAVPGPGPAHGGQPRRDPAVEH